MIGKTFRYCQISKLIGAVEYASSFRQRVRPGMANPWVEV